jgi:hypothetical protein
MVEILSKRGLTMRFLVYTCVIAALAALAAPCVANDMTWQVFTSGGVGTGPNQARMLQMNRGQSTSAPGISGVWDILSVQYVWSDNGGASWLGPKTVECPNPFPDVHPSLNVPTDAHPWICYWAQTGPTSMGAYLSIWRDKQDPDDWFHRVYFSSDGYAGVMSTVMSTTGGAPMIYAVTTVKSQDNSYLKFYAFDTLSQVCYYQATLAVANYVTNDFHPTIDYTPGDRVHIAYEGQDSRIWYLTWQAPVTPSQIRLGVQPNWYQGLTDVSYGLQPLNHNPSIDADGDMVYCAWRGPTNAGQNVGEVWQRSMRVSVWPPTWSLQPRNVSNTPERESDRPQCGTGTTVTWQECVAPDNHTEVLASFPGATVNISQAPGYQNQWPQNAVRNPIPPEPYKIDCHTLWSQDEISSPNRRFFRYHLYSYIPMLAGGTEYPTYLRDELGLEKPSAYCLERTGFKTYGEMRVDYGASRLVYGLPYLDPTCDYIAECVLFNGESTAIAQRLIVGGVAVQRLLLRPGTCDTLRFALPRAAYKDTRAQVELVRESGPFACLANTIKLYSGAARVSGPDGAQSGLTEAVRQSMTSAPNPFSSRCALRFSEALPAGAAVRVYDAGGRFVRDIVWRRAGGAGSQATWDGTDATGNPVVPGVYYCRVVSDQGVSSVKVIRQ